ncbi:MAG: hypothetical protein JWO36_3691 [Myxococcales bacterium]|nr:hypothetical protein [Myxococcales bacterium]
MSTCDQVTDDLAELVDGNRDAIARHADHLASCDTCRDARHEATKVAAMLVDAGSDHVPAADLVDKLLAAVDREAKPAPKPLVTNIAEPTRRASRSRTWLVAGAAAAMAASGTAVVMSRGGGAKTPASSAPSFAKTGSIATITNVTRAAKDGALGIEIKDQGGWRALTRAEQIAAGAELRTDARTRMSLDLAEGTKLVLDHNTAIAFDPAELRHIRITGGRLLADVAHIDGRPATIATPSGTIDVVGTRFIVTSTDAVTAVQVVRGQIVLNGSNGAHDAVRAGEEGTIENGALSVSPVPALAHEAEWAELGNPAVKTDEAMSGLGALRAYKPGEKRDRDWNLALAKHDVKVRIVGPIARTEITETFRNDSTTELEGVYQFPLPPDAQIDGLALDVSGGFVEGAFVDKERGAKIWKGVIEKATPKIQLATDRNDVIWVNGSWRDPALLDWKRGGRFELRVFPIPAKGQRTIKLAYTQVVAPRGPWRQYVYPLPHSSDGSTVADQLTVDVEVRGAMPGFVRSAGYDLTPDAARRDVNALTLTQSGFVPRGDLVIGYRATDGAAELRAWTYAGGAAVAPDEKLLDKKNVGIDPAVVSAQRMEAADTRPTAVLALRPTLPRWRETKSHDYMIVLDASQSMVGERFTRATELAASLIDQMDRRDRFSVMTCDSDCRKLGDLRAPSPQAVTEMRTWLASDPQAGATDVVASVRAAREALQGNDDRERWVLYVGDGFASTGFRRVADVERALAGSPIHVSTIGIGADADTALLAAAARGGGGSFLAFVPGQRMTTAAASALESTYGAALSDAKIELPAGLADVAPTIVPTVRAGDEVLLAARVTGDVQGDVIVRGTVAGQPFEQRYPLHLTVSSASGNGFVPRLWATLAIEQRERNGGGDERAKIVALSQAYGVMSRETSLLVLESQAMFDAFGVDRHVPTAKWTGEEQLEEVASTGTLPIVAANDLARDESRSAPAKKAKAPAMDKADDYEGPVGTSAASTAPAQDKPMPAPQAAPVPFGHGSGRGGGGLGILGNSNRGYGFEMRRTWVRVPSVTPYDTVSPSIIAAIGEAERNLAKTPDSRERHRALVQALSYAGELDRARDVANKWLDRDRLDPQALGYRADLLGRAGGQRELALRTLAGLVDLDADRPALHERMVVAYEQVGRMQQACSHRIALAALSPKQPKLAASAMRCLRSVGRTGDADLIVRALPDDAARAAAEKAALVDVAPTKASGDLVVAARWDRPADLDLSLVTPDGTRVSWMGGRTDAIVTDATSTDRELLAVKSLRRGNYLIEISRATPSSGPVRGTLDISALGSKRSLPFELTGDHTVVGRISISLQEQLEEVAPNQPRMIMGAVSDPGLRQVMLARSQDARSCYVEALNRFPALRGRVTLSVGIDRSGAMKLSASGPEPLATCVRQAFGSMHVGVRNGLAIQVPFTFMPE